MIKSTELSAFEQMVSSAVGAVLTSLVVTPFDVVKTRMQIQYMDEVKERGNLNSKDGCGIRQELKEAVSTHHQKHVQLLRHQISCHQCGIVILRNGLMEHMCLEEKLKIQQSRFRFNGTADAFAKITRQEGFGALYRGLPPTLVMAVPLTVMYFTAYDRLSDQLGRDKTSTPILAGSIARCNV